MFSSANRDVGQIPRLSPQSKKSSSLRMSLTSCKLPEVDILQVRKHRGNPAELSQRWRRFPLNSGEQEVGAREEGSQAAAHLRLPF